MVRSEEHLGDAYAGRTVCVTGAAGFLGGHAVDALIGLGAVVHAIDDLSSSTLEHLGESLAAHPEQLQVTYGSVLEDIALRTALENSEIVFHLASTGSHAGSIESPERCFEVNILGTLRVLQTARREDVARVVAVTSPRCSDERITPYGASQHSAELAVRAWASSYDLHAMTLRMASLYGPRQSPQVPRSSVVAAHLTRAISGLPPLIRNDTPRDHLHISDAVRALLFAGIAPAAASASSIDIASGEPLEPEALAQRTLIACDREDLQPQPDRDPGTAFPIATPDLAHARDLIGFEPNIPLDQGLRETADWYRRSLGATA